MKNLIKNAKIHMSSVYYAHSKLIYDSPREKQERKFLEKNFWKVVCPNRDMGDLGSIDPYLRMVDKNKIVVCSEYNSYIGKGVYSEIMEGLKTNKRVYCLRKLEGKYILLPVATVSMVDPNDWKMQYGKIHISSEEPLIFKG